MYKKLLCVALLVCLVFSFSACSSSESQVEKPPVTPSSGGVAKGEVGDVMRTPNFDFTVTEARAISQYAKKDPLDGEKYIVVEVTITNTSANTLTFLDTDFQLQWGTSGFADTMVAWDDRMAPMETQLLAGQSISYHYVYSVGIAVTQFSFCYLHQGEGNEIYFVDFSL